MSNTCVMAVVEVKMVKKEISEKMKKLNKEAKEGKTRLKAQVTDRIHPKMVSASHDWWYPELPGPEHGVWESNINLLVDPFAGSDPTTGSSELRGLLCKVYKADGPPPGVKDNNYK